MPAASGRSEDRSSADSLQVAVQPILQPAAAPWNQPPEPPKVQATAPPAPAAAPAKADQLYEEVLAQAKENQELEVQFEKALLAARLRAEATLRKNRNDVESRLMAPEACDGKSCKGSYGTAVNFVNNPLEAADQALSDKKLLLVLTISGNFEESKFT